MDRRALLALAGASTFLAAASRAQQSGSGLRAELIRIYAAADGESHIERIEISNSAGEIPVTGMTARAYARNRSNDAEWHTAPRRQFAINMSGSLEVEISDGSRHEIGQGDLVYLEDVTGKGHVTRVLTPVTNLFIHVPQDWDMLSWARG
ncbi:MAG: hypothetical protein PVG24_04800 [Gammaproteobacteria bacterium]|jgi:hypothetical protein